MATDRGDHRSAVQLHRISARLAGKDLRPYLPAAMLMAGDTTGAHRRLGSLIGAASAVEYEHSMSGTLLLHPLTSRAYPLVAGLPRSYADVAEAVSDLSQRQRMQAGSAASSAAAARALRQLMLEQQFPRTCSRLLLYRFTQGFGFGAHAHMLSLAMAVAIATHRTLILHEEDGWWLAERHVCRARNWHCYFQPLTNCTVPALRAYHAKADGGGTVLSVFAEASADAPLVQLDERAQVQLLRSSAHKVGGHSYGDLKTFVPRRFKRLGLLWWRSELIAFAFRPTERVRAFIEQHRRKIGLRADERARFAVHVRHGDKVPRHRSCGIHAPWHGMAWHTPQATCAGRLRAAATVAGREELGAWPAGWATVQCLVLSA